MIDQNRYIKNTFIGTVGLLSIGVMSAYADIGNLSQQGWQEKSFVGNTTYSSEVIDGKSVIRATAESTASALYKKVKVDLQSTPMISWGWKIQSAYNNDIEREKRGDDFPARVYVVYKNGFFAWNTLAINYVWSSSESVGAHWKSAYTDNAHVLVLRTGENEVGNWVHEKRDVVKDFKEYFGIDINRLDGFAVMVDGDNTKSATTSWFADIGFAAE